jgi:hypothetical protein
MEEIGRIPLDIVLRRNGAEIAYRIIDGQVAIVHLKRNTFNILNAVATRIWELADGRTVFGKIAERIFQEFNIDWPTLGEL